MVVKRLSFVSDILIFWILLYCDNPGCVGAGGEDRSPGSGQAQLLGLLQGHGGCDARLTAKTKTKKKIKTNTKANSRVPIILTLIWQTD